MSGRLLFLHGLGSSPQQWDRVAGECGHTVEAPRLPWAWDSARSWGRTPGNDLDVLVGHIEPGDVVVAHSFAATLLLLALDRYRDLPIAGAVLVSPFYLGRQNALDWDEARRLFDDFEVILAEGLIAGVHRTIRANRLAAMARAARDAIGPPGWGRFMGAYAETAWTDLTTLQVPLTTVHGEQDAAAAPAGSVRLRHDVHGTRSFMLPGIGHFPMLESPAAFVDALGMALAFQRRAGPQAPQQHERPCIRTGGRPALIAS